VEHMLLARILTMLLPLKIVHPEKKKEATM
jgi:hypothetical protein